jgi:tight adherence protein C
MNMPFSMSSDDLFVAFATLSVLATLFAIWHGLVIRDPMAARVKALSERRNALRSASRVRRNRAGSDLRSSGLTMMRLSQAGWRSRDAVVVYLFAKAILPFVFGGVALMFLFFSFSSGQSSASPMRAIIVVAGFCGGFFGADIWVKNVASKRVKEMTRAMPDALDLMVICAEAGLSLDATMTRVGQEIAGGSPVLAEEFSLTAIELGFLPNRQSALTNLMNRTNMPKLRALVNGLLQTERYGTPLANSLRVLAAEFRDERMLRAEEKAAKLPAKMTVPMILFILPALFVVLAGPAAIQVLHTFRH